MIKTNNRIVFKKSFNDFKDNRLTFSVSSRKIRPDIDISDYLKIFYMYCDIRQIESVFGSTTVFSRLYGGRLDLAKYRLTEDHLVRLAECGIHLSLTLTNHFFTEDAYRESWPLLELHHKKGNSVICTNDRLAVRLRQDFPLYEIKASIIKKIDTMAKVKRALEIYHSLTLPMDKNDDDDFLNSLPEKHRIILFGNANCAYTCPARTCYLGFSQEISGRPVTSVCSKEKAPRLDMGHVFFNVKKLADMGFIRFKLVPLAPQGSVGVCRDLGRKKGYLLQTIKQNRVVNYLCSYPKCGRTWLRFIIANYFNLEYDLGVRIDMHSVFSLLPNDDIDPLKADGTIGYTQDTRFPLILSSHEEYNEEKFTVGKNSRIVFLFRAVPEVVVSDYFHSTRFMKFFSGGLKEFIRSPKGGLVKYCRYLNSWAPMVNAGGILALTYEMLHADTEKTAVNVLTFLDVPVDTGILREAVRLSSFEFMQALEIKKGNPRHPGQAEDPEARRVRKGEAAGSAVYLDREDLDYIHRTCALLLTDDAKALLRQYQLWNL